MNASKIKAAGARVAKARAAERQAIDVIAGELLAAGGDANVLEAARLSGVARSTLYRRLYELRNSNPETTAPATAPADPDLEP